MAAQVCSDVSEAIEICPIRQLYFKPLAKLCITVSLPEIKVAGVSISNWEVMEKLKAMVSPDQFAVLRVVESTLETIRFEGETETKAAISKFLTKLDGNFVKLSGFAESLRVKVVEAKIKFPSRHEWDSFYRDAKNLDECNPGERPDTVVIKGLPSKWFSNQESGDKPSEQVVISVFQHFGKIRCIDVPILDKYRERITKSSNEFQTFYFGSHLHFDVYIQYSQYQGFVAAMAGLKGMKLVHVSDDGRAAAANVQVDFDRTCHLNAKNIQRRNNERQELIDSEFKEEERKRIEIEEEEKRKIQERLEMKKREAEKVCQMMEELRKKEERRKRRERKRKRKMEEIQKKEEAKREKEMRMAEKRCRLESQRKEEAMEVLGELIKRVAEKKAEEDVENRKRALELEMLKQMEDNKRRQEEEKLKKVEEERKEKEKLEQQEKELRDKLIKNLREMNERKKELERELFRKQITKTTKLSSVVRSKVSE